MAANVKTFLCIKNKVFFNKSFVVSETSDKELLKIVIDGKNFFCFFKKQPKEHLIKLLGGSVPKKEVEKIKTGYWFYGEYDENYNIVISTMKELGLFKNRNKAMIKLLYHKLYKPAKEKLFEQLIGNYKPKPTLQQRLRKLGWTP